MKGSSLVRLAITVSAACVAVLIGAIVGFAFRSSAHHVTADSIPAAYGIPVAPANISQGCGVWAITDHQGKDHILVICDPRGKTQSPPTVSVSN
jgi:hypothetical protein